jgi:hypothetical protein
VTRHAPIYFLLTIIITTIFLSYPTFLFFALLTLIPSYLQRDEFPLLPSRILLLRIRCVNPTQHHTAQHTAPHNTAQHNTTQDRTGQHNTAQHETAEHSATQHIYTILFHLKASKCVCVCIYILYIYVCVCVCLHVCAYVWIAF